MRLDAVTVGIQVDGRDVEADIVRARVVEGLSELFEADVTLSLARASVTAVLPGAKVKLSVGRGADDANARPFYGLVRSVERLDQGDGMSLDRPLLRLVVVPTVWRAGLTVRSRAFVDMSIDDVITKVLNEAGVKGSGLASTAPHPLIVQYQESDLALVFRLLEDVGATHVVEHSGGVDDWRFFLADSARVRSVAPRPMAWTTLATGQSSEEGVVRAGRLDALGTNAFRVTDIDRRIERVAWEGSGKRGREPFTQELREPRRVKGDAGAKLALRVADERRAEREMHWLETSDMKLKPGERLEAELSQADAEAGATTQLLVVRVEHEVETREDAVVYRNRAEAVTTATPFYPARVAPRPTITAPQTGIVKGFPEGKQLVVNVAMDWGAQSPVVLPVRMTQPLAGSNHGAMLLPHKGTEVLVQFIDGVPERPVLVGALYHQAAEAPAAAGVAGGDSSFQSRLVMLGERGPTNVIEVDDATRDSEVVKMLAINDVAVKVGRNEKREVEGTFEESVKGDVTLTLGAKRGTTVTGDETYETDGKVSITVHKTGRVLVNESLQMTADTKLSLVSGNTRADFSPSAAKITVGGAVVELTASGVKLSIGGSSVELTGAAVKITSSVVNLNNGALQVT